LKNATQQRVEKTLSGFLSSRAVKQLKVCFHGGKQPNASRAAIPTCRSNDNSPQSDVVAGLQHHVVTGRKKTALARWHQAASRTRSAAQDAGHDLVVAACRQGFRHKLQASIGTLLLCLAHQLVFD